MIFKEILVTAAILDGGWCWRTHFCKGTTLLKFGLLGSVVSMEICRWFLSKPVYVTLGDFSSFGIKIIWLSNLLTLSLYKWRLFRNALLDIRF